MRLQERRVMHSLAVVAALSLVSFGCGKDSNSVTAPAGGMLTVSGTWNGNFKSYSQTCAGSAVMADLQQNGSSVTGTMTAAACGISGYFRGDLHGNMLTGNVEMSGCDGGAVSGTVSPSGMSLVIDDFTKKLVGKGQVVAYGGTASLHR